MIKEQFIRANKEGLNYLIDKLNFKLHEGTGTTVKRVVSSNKEIQIKLNYYEKNITILDKFGNSVVVGKSFTGKEINSFFAVDSE